MLTVCDRYQESQCRTSITFSADEVPGAPGTTASRLPFAPVCTSRAKEPLRRESPGSCRALVEIKKLSPADLTWPFSPAFTPHSKVLFKLSQGPKHTLPYPFPSARPPEDLAFFKTGPKCDLFCPWGSSESTGLFFCESGASRKLPHASLCPRQTACSRYKVGAQ